MPWRKSASDVSASTGARSGPGGSILLLVLPFRPRSDAQRLSRRRARITALTLRDRVAWWRAAHGRR
jgi:hypothetical protein